MNSKSPKTYRELRASEEMVNSITHAIGTLLSIVALVILLMVAQNQGDTLHLISFSIYGSTLILMYLSSTLYHSFSSPRIKDVFARFDHVSIFLLIAGTYTPILLINIHGFWGWSLLVILWAIALTGAVIRAIYLHRYRKIMVFVYLAMGWMFILAGKQIYQSLPTISVTFLILGGVVYSLGVVFYMWRNLPYAHGIWHLFVMAGSILHFFAIYFSVK